MLKIQNKRLLQLVKLAAAAAMTLYGSPVDLSQPSPFRCPLHLIFV